MNVIEIIIVDSPSVLICDTPIVRNLNLHVYVYMLVF